MGRCLWDVEHPQCLSYGKSLHGCHQLQMLGTQMHQISYLWFRNSLSCKYLEIGLDHEEVSLYIHTFLHRTMASFRLEKICNEHSTGSCGHEEGWGQQYPALGEIAECRGRATNSLCDQGASPVQGLSRPGGSRDLGLACWREKWSGWAFSNSQTG